MKSSVVTIKNHVAVSTKAHMSYKIVVMALFALLILVGTMLVTYTTYATSGNELEQFETQKKALIKENTNLTLDNAKATSLGEIEKKAKDYGMVKDDSAIVLKAK